MSMVKQGRIQRVVVVIAYISYLLALASGVGAYIKYQELGGEHPVTAALSATIVFFIGVGIVLHVIGRTDLPSLKVNTDE